MTGRESGGEGKEVTGQVVHMGGLGLLPRGTWEPWRAVGQNRDLPTRCSLAPSGGFGEGRLWGLRAKPDSGVHGRSLVAVGRIDRGLQKG